MTHPPGTGPVVIRFNCANCGRRHEVPPALARLRIMCKGCGQPLSVPEVGDPDPPEPEPAPPLPPAKPAPLPLPSKAADPDDEPLFEKEPFESPEADSGAPGPTPAARGDAHRERAAGPAPTPPPPRGALLPVIVDVAVGLILLAAGVFLGETLAGKSTPQVWRDAGGAVSFPPPELIMWAAPPLVAVLVYGLLAARGLGVGGWLRRRAAR